MLTIRSLHAVDLMRQCIQRVTDIKQTANNEEDISIRYWMPLLFGLHEVIMTCDLEVRTRALSYLFDTLKTQGGSFTTSFWGILAKGVLFPIFEDMNLSSGNAAQLNSKFANKEELAVWLSTTLIQALRQFVDLFTNYYQTILFILPDILSLLKTCLLHENESLSRVGSTCIQQLIEKNAASFDIEGWEKLGDLFCNLFEETSPDFLFFNYKDDISLNTQFNFLSKPLGPAPDKKEFQKQIPKCIYHLSVVQTLQDVLSTGANDEVYKFIPNKTMIRLIDCFQSSYRLAHVFNESTDLRQALYKMSYMKVIMYQLTSATAEST